VSEFLRLPVPDLTRIALRNNGVFQSAGGAHHRRPPAGTRPRLHRHAGLGDTLGPTLAGPDAAVTRRRIEALVAYLERLQRKPAE
jgi:hypothetical protein